MEFVLYYSIITLPYYNGFINVKTTIKKSVKTIILICFCFIDDQRPVFLIRFKNFYNHYCRFRFFLTLRSHCYKHTYKQQKNIIYALFNYYRFIFYFFNILFYFGCSVSFSKFLYFKTLL